MGTKKGKTARSRKEARTPSIGNVKAKKKKVPIRLATKKKKKSFQGGKRCIRASVGKRGLTRGGEEKKKKGNACVKLGGGKHVD